MELKKRKVNKEKYWQYSFYSCLGLFCVSAIVILLINHFYPEASNLFYGGVMFTMAGVHIAFEELVGKKYYLEDSDDGSDR